VGDKLKNKDKNKNKKQEEISQTQLNPVTQTQFSDFSGRKSSAGLVAP